MLYMYVAMVDTRPRNSIHYCLIMYIHCIIECSIRVSNYFFKNKRVFHRSTAELLYSLKRGGHTKNVFKPGARWPVAGACLVS